MTHAIRRIPTLAVSAALLASPCAAGEALRALEGAQAVSAAAVSLNAAGAASLGSAVYDHAEVRRPSVEAASHGALKKPKLPSKKKAGPVRPQEFGEEPEEGGGLPGSDQIGKIIADALKSKPVQEALDGIRKEQAAKFSKEVVDGVTADPRVKKLTEGPGKTQSILVQSGIAGAGALLAGIAFATGAAALGYVGLGILGAGLISLLITWLV